MFRLLVSLVCVLVLLLGCSDNAKKKEAAQALEKAQSQAQSLSVDQALEQYQAVIDTYPQTPQAEAALQAIAQLQQQKFKDFRSHAAALLERVSTVLEGYQAYAGKLPLKLEDLDAGNYMFDSKYLAELLPTGAELYLSLDSEKAQTQMWLQQADAAEVVTRNLGTPLLTDLSLAELNTLKSKWQEVAKAGRLTQVRL